MGRIFQHTKINEKIHTKLSLQKDFRQLGIVSGDTVMVHASMKSVGVIMGGYDQLIAAMLEVLGVHGTMMMYIGCDPVFEVIGRGKVTEEEEQFVFEHCPPFDFHKNRARQDFGVLAEFFRSYEGTVCSSHVGWRMAANSGKADWLMAEHPLNYGADAGSPMDKLLKSNGKILLIGTSHDTTTFLHHVEGLTNVASKRIVRFKVPLLVQGKRCWVDVEEHNSSTGILEWHEGFFKDTIDSHILDCKINSRKVGNADAFLLRAQDLKDYAIPFMEQKARMLNAE